MRVGIVGLGTIGQALAKAIDRGEIAAQLSAVHSRTRDKAQAFASTLRRVDAVTITTRKPPQGLAGAPYVEAHGIDVYAFTTETVIFEGSAREACKGFPANVNVAAALSLAGIGPDRTRIRILVAPGNTRNMHDVEVGGEFGRLTTHIENVPTDNPRTGKLSYLSALAMLKQIVSPCHYGT